MTATANDRVRQDILNKLALKNAAQIMTSVDRPNIYLGVSQQPDEQAKNQFLANLVKKSQGPGIIYFSSRQKTMAIATFLQQETDLKIAYYHAAVINPGAVFNSTTIYARTTRFNLYHQCFWDGD
ncbi:hypothetical protein QY880_01285 [Latilactobacillus sakei]